MIWGKVYKEQFTRYKYHKWFAWYPVQLDDGRWVWLQTIWQKKCLGWEGWCTRVLSRKDLQ